MRKLVLVGAVLALVLAGCTQQLQGGEEPAELENRGVVVEEATVLDSTVKQDRETRLVVRLQNTNPMPVTDFSATLSNTGEVVKTPLQGSEQCSGGTIPAATGSVPSSVVCAWRLDTSNVDVSVGEKNFPITATLRYTSSIGMQEDSMKFLFVDENTNPQPSVTSFDNGEVSVSVDHPTRLYAGEKTNISLFVTTSNIGEGMLPTRQVNLSYDGSLFDDAGFTIQGGLCERTEFLRQDARSASIECILNGVEKTPRTQHTLRMNATYVYRKTLPMSLTVVP